MFHYLESEDVTVPDNEIHLIVLHYIFIPRINKMLAEVTDSWNNHKSGQKDFNMSEMNYWK